MRNWLINGKIFLASSLILLFIVNPVSAAIQQMPKAPVIPNAPIINVDIPNVPALPIAPSSPISSLESNNPNGPISNSGGMDASKDEASSNLVETQSEIQPNIIELERGVMDSLLDVGNDNTGANSDNNAGIGSGPVLNGSSNSNNIFNNNNGVVDNSIIAGANSGDNNSNYNTGDGSVSTGDSNVILSILNFINTAIVALPGGQINAIFAQIFGDLMGNYLVDQNSGESYSLTGSRLDVGNSDTGANSNNLAMINSGTDTMIANNNTGAANNNLLVSANTGGNSASYNTGNGSVSTGDANVALNLMNFLNSSIVAGNVGLIGVANIFGNWFGNLVIPDEYSGGLDNLAIIVGNNNTGAGSTNNAIVDSSSSTEIINNNTADILNNIILDTNTGGNSGSYNTGDSNVVTGDSEAKLGVNNVANQNVMADTAFMLMINILGYWNGVQITTPIIIATKNLLPAIMSGGMTVGNTNTGAGSTNDAIVNLSENNTIINNNDANIANNINVSANTGKNSSSYNTGAGGIATGDANILANVMNFANMNIQASRVVMMVVNVFGDWVGSVSNTDKPKTIYASNTETKINTNKNIYSAFTGNDNSYVGDISISVEPVKQQLLLALSPNPTEDSASSKIITAKANYFSGGGSGTAFAADGKFDGGNTGVLGYMRNNSMEIFGTLLVIYLFSVGYFVYCKKTKGLSRFKNIKI